MHKVNCPIEIVSRFLDEYENATPVRSSALIWLDNHLRSMKSEERLALLPLLLEGPPVELDQTLKELEIDQSRDEVWPFSGGVVLLALLTHEPSELRHILDKEEGRELLVHALRFVNIIVAIADFKARDLSRFEGLLRRWLQLSPRQAELFEVNRAIELFSR